MRNNVQSVIDRLRGMAFTPDEVAALNELIQLGTMRSLRRSTEQNDTGGDKVQVARKCLVEIGIPEDELNKLIVAALLTKKG